MSLITNTVGTFNGVLQATRYCMTVKDSLVYMDGVSEEDSYGDRYLNLANFLFSIYSFLMQISYATNK